VSVKTGLVLSGGGARGAYQVGVLKAIADLYPKNAHNPFNVISGTSAGAINAVAIAASANNFRLAVKKTERIWNNLSVDNIYKASRRDLAFGVSRLLLSLLNHGIGRNKPISLLNNDPLRELISHVVQFRNIQRRIDAGYLEAVAVTATGYTSGEVVTFYQGNEAIDQWREARSIGVRSVLGVDHLMASSAMPAIFPAVKLSREYFGDGALRQLSPIKPAIAMGVERVLVIGLSGNKRLGLNHDEETHSPSMAQIGGQIFKRAFLDSMDNDLDHMMRINKLIGMVQLENPHAELGDMRPIDLLAINPSIEFDSIAARHIADLPKSMQRFMSTIGATGPGGGASMASYLLFEAGFCKELIEHGYRDAMELETEIRDFF
jgi:NTE family protein